MENEDYNYGKEVANYMRREFDFIKENIDKSYEGLKVIEEIGKDDKYMMPLIHLKTHTLQFSMVLKQLQKLADKKNEKGKETKSS